MITSQSNVGVDLFKYTAFASDLYDDVPDLRIGFPRVINTNLGNGQPFIGTSKKVNADGDIEYVRYYQQLGCIQLIIFNT